MKTIKIARLDIFISMFIAPVEKDISCEIESLLLRIFEYGDYSFRSALSGEYSETLNCVYFLAKHQDNIVGAAGCLYSKKNPTIAIVGPVGILPEYRLRGIGTSLLKSIIEHLKQNNCMGAYLGVSNDNPAVKLYSKLGFKQYHGIVRRLLLCEETDFNNVYFNRNNNVTVRQSVWGDFPGIQALITEPGCMYTIDYRKHIFSSKYIEPVRFLSIFPEMMKENKKYYGLLNVLVAGEKENVAGFANICLLPGKAQEHIGELEFFVHDNFIDNTKMLLEKTIGDFIHSSVIRINCYCAGCDHLKSDIIESIGGRLIAILPENVFLNGVYENILIYEIRRKIK